MQRLHAQQAGGSREPSGEHSLAARGTDSRGGEDKTERGKAAERAEAGAIGGGEKISDESAALVAEPLLPAGGSAAWPRDLPQADVRPHEELQVALHSLSHAGGHAGGNNSNLAHQMRETLIKAAQQV